MIKMTSKQWEAIQKDEDLFYGRLAHVEANTGYSGSLHNCIILGMGKGSSIRLWDSDDSRLRCAPYTDISFFHIPKAFYIEVEQLHKDYNCACASVSFECFDSFGVSLGFVEDTFSGKVESGLLRMIDAPEGTEYTTVSDVDFGGQTGVVFSYSLLSS